MSDHKRHIVQWRGARPARLYCINCGCFTQYETQTPNKLHAQPLEQALAPGNVIVTLEVHGMKHKNQSNWRSSNG